MEFVFKLKVIIYIISIIISHFYIKLQREVDLPIVGNLMFCVCRFVSVT